MSLFDLTKRVVEKKLGVTASNADANRLDAQVPLQARIGGLIKLIRADFALLEGSLVKDPGAGPFPIVAVGRLRLADDDASVDSSAPSSGDHLALHRIYTSVGAHRTGQGASFLQVLTHESDPTKVLDLTYYQFLCRSIPETKEDQAMYQGGGAGLGEETYSLADDQLGAAGYSPQAITALLAGKEALDYTRDTPTPGAYQEPYRGLETRLDDVQGASGLRKKVWFMPYTRQLASSLGGEATERLLISFEVLQSLDGATQQSVYVDFYTGIALDPAHVQVI